MPSSSFQRLELPEEFKSDFQLLFSPEIKSTQKEYRQQLRFSLIQMLKPLGLAASEEGDLLNLSLLPHSKKFSISLSHSPEGSLVLISTKRVPIGVDLEVEKRISTSVLKRISTDNEFRRHPKDFDLFTSKEACWKAINRALNVATLSHIETLGWKAHNDPWWAFSARTNGQLINGNGYSRRFKQFFLSFFILDSTFVKKHRQR